MDTTRDISIKQASDVYLDVTPDIGGDPLSSIVAAKYIIFDKDGNILVERTFNQGITFSINTVTIHLTDTDTDIPCGSYFHECVVKDPLDNDIFILTGRVRLSNTTARI